MKGLLIILFFISVILTQSCVLSDCWYDYEWIIENKTNSNISINYKTFDIYP